MTINLNYYQNKVIVVAGAGGFIASHLCDRLLDLGARVIGLDNFITSHPDNLISARAHSNFNFIKLDLNNQEHLVATLGTINHFDALCHLASPASPPLYQHYPVETYLVNTLATQHILTWIKDHQPAARFLFASTSEVYGDPTVHPQVESYWGNVNPNGVRSCYDESKRCGETISGIFNRDFGLDVRIMRIFNTYGPRMNLADGRILPHFLKLYLSGQKLTIYGDGNQTRSYCFVSDLVEGIIRLLAGDALKGETINLGNPDELTVLQTAQIFNELIGQNPDNLEYRPLPEDDPSRRQPDIEKAKQLLNWQPQIVFREGLKMMLDSYQKGHA